MSGNHWLFLLLCCFQHANASNTHTIAYSGTEYCNKTGLEQSISWTNHIKNNKGKFGLSIWFRDGMPDPKATSYDYSQGTGLKLSNTGITKIVGSYPLSNSINHYSAFQLGCNDYGSWINTWTIAGKYDSNLGGRSSIFSYTSAKNIGDIIFDNIYDEYWLQVNKLNINRVNNSWGGIGQISLVSYFRTTLTPEIQSFAMIFLIRDTRNYSYSPFVAHDTYTPYFSSPMISNEYLNIPVQYGFSEYSSGDKPLFNKSYRVQIDRKDFVKILNKINLYCKSHRQEKSCKYSYPLPSLTQNNDPRWLGYGLANAGLLHEVFSIPYGNISMGINASGLGIYRYNK